LEGPSIPINNRENVKSPNSTIDESISFLKDINDNSGIINIINKNNKKTNNNSNTSNLYSGDISNSNINNTNINTDDNNADNYNINDTKSNTSNNSINIDDKKGHNDINLNIINDVSSIKNNDSQININSSKNNEDGEHDGGKKSTNNDTKISHIDDNIENIYDKSSSDKIIEDAIKNKDTIKNMDIIKNIDTEHDFQDNPPINIINNNDDGISSEDDDDDDYLTKNINHPINLSQISSIIDSEMSSDMSDILKNDLIYEALNLKETSDYLLNSSTSFSEMNTNDSDLIEADLKSLDDIKLEIVHKILEKKSGKKKNDKINKGNNNNNNNKGLEMNIPMNSKVNNDSNEYKRSMKGEEIEITNQVISIEKMRHLSKVNKISINLYSLNLKYPSEERFVKYKIKYSIPDSIPILTKTTMYTQFITDTQTNNTTEIKLNHFNNINLSFNTELLKYWLKLDTMIIINVEAIRDTNKNIRLQSKDEKDDNILWKGQASIRCKDLINLPTLKLKSYIPLYKEISSRKKLGFIYIYILLILFLFLIYLYIFIK